MHSERLCTVSVFVGKSQFSVSNSCSLIKLNCLQVFTREYCIYMYVHIQFS